MPLGLVEFRDTLPGWIWQAFFAEGFESGQENHRLGSILSVIFGGLGIGFICGPGGGVEVEKSDKEECCQQ